MKMTPMAVVRWRLVQAVDLFDDRVLGHRFQRVCLWCGESSWWEAGYYRPGAHCPVDRD